MRQKPLRQKGRQHDPRRSQHPDSHRRTARPPGRAPFHQHRRPRPSQQGRVLASSAPPGRGRIPRFHRGGGRHRAHLRPPSHSGGGLRHRHLARGQRHSAPRRSGGGHDAHGPGLEGERGRPGRHRAGARHAQAAQRIRARPGPVLPHRSGCGCLARRHGGDAGFGHQRRALRDHARERAGADRRSGRRPHHPHFAARKKVRRRLRPHAAVRGQRRHARHHHRSDAEAVRHPRGDGCRSLLLRRSRRCGQHGDSGDPARHSGRAHRVAGRRPDGLGEQVLQAQLSGEGHACSSSSTARTPA